MLIVILDTAQKSNMQQSKVLVVRQRKIACCKNRMEKIIEKVLFCSEVAQALQLDSVILIALFFPDTCRSELHLDVFLFLCLRFFIIMATPFSRLHFSLPTCIFYFPQYFNKLLLASCCVTQRNPG